MKGSHVELNCSVEGDPPTYVAWINVTDGSVLQNRTGNTSYVIQSVSSLHKGTYRCLTGNIHGNSSRETTILDVFCKYLWWEQTALYSLKAFVGVHVFKRVSLKLAYPYIYKYMYAQISYTSI